MGEYLVKGNEQIFKVGTGLNWRPIRRDEVQVLVKSGYTCTYNLNKALHDEMVSWRFPYPDEDKDKESFVWEEMNQRSYERRETFLADPTWLLGWDFHNKIVMSVSPESFGRPNNKHGGINFNMPCPLSKGFDVNNQVTSAEKQMPSYVALSTEYYVDGKPVTVFQCAWCGMMFTQTEDEIEVTKEYLKNYAKRSRNDMWLEIADRIHPHIDRKEG